MRIRDDGPGMPEEEANILRGRQAVEPLDHGTGIDLWRAYWIVDLANGRVTVNADGSGTAVVVAFESASDPESDGSE